MPQHSVLVSIAAMTLALGSARPAQAAPPTLVSCQSGGETHTIQMPAQGKLLVDGTLAYLVSASRQTGDTSMITYRLLTSAGHEIELSRTGDSASPAIRSYWDRGVIGGECLAGSTIDTGRLDTLVARSAEVQRSMWRLADCALSAGEESRLTLDYSAGFKPGTIILRSSPGPQGETLAYVFSGFAEEGAAGTLYTSLQGQGAYSYSALGRHSQALGPLVIAKSNITGRTQVVTGEEPLDSSLGECAISNLWHVKRLLSH